jgi:CRISPR-associated protein Csm1
MHAALSRAKQRRYAELGDDLYAQVFEPQAHGGNREETCAVCGEEGRRVELLGESDDPQAKLCALCRSFQDLGARLTAARYVALGRHAARPMERGGALNVLRAFGVSVQFAGSPHAALAFSAQDPPASVIVYALDDADQWPASGQVPTVRAVRYTVHRIPPMDFSALQEQAEGIERLGVLRMDVDRLGELFSRGFGQADNSRATLARLAALSFQLSVFFEGWVKRLCEQSPASIYAVYAGGDDVFLIGPWDQMPALAATISSDLAAFAGHNPDVHLSGGLVFIHGKYPVYQAAEDAKSALDAAKAMPDQNAVNFLGQAWTWPEFERVTAKHARLLNLVRGEEASGLDGPQAILQVLRQLAEDEADKAKQLGNRPVWGPWMWQGAYLLTRMAERARRKKPALESALLAVRDELSADNYRELRLWGAAARWAQLLLRKNHPGE